jgi:hypothetical protein
VIIWTRENKSKTNLAFHSERSFKDLVLAALRLGPLTARRVRHGVGAWPVCQPEALVCMKARFVSPLFFQQLAESPFLPFPLLHGILPHTSAGSTPSRQPLDPNRRIQRSQSKNPLSLLPALIRWTPSAALSRRPARPWFCTQ